MYTKHVLSILALLTATVVVAGADGPEGRLFYGQPVDNLRQFPHHVYIIVAESGRRCGGTILSSRWVLTSASCVKDAIRVDLYFRKQQQYDIRGDFFSISVNRDHVFVYPTKYDDIALIKVPTSLVFSESLAPINISSLPIEALRDRFTVMPGFSDFLTTTTITTTTSTTPKTTTKSTTTAKTTTKTTEMTTTTTRSTTSGFGPPSQSTYAPGVPMPVTPAPTPPEMPPDYPPSVLGLYDDRHFEGGDSWDILKYGMFSVLDNRMCKKILGNSFDEYTQICVDSWGDNPNRPCESDFGSGLILGWPARSEVVGLFSMASPGCESNLPTVFTFIGKYMGWIEGMMRG